MSRAAFTITKWRHFRSAQLNGTTMEELIDADLKHSNPPSSDTIVELMLLGDRQYMTALLSTMSSGAIPSSQQYMSIEAISHTPTHRFHKKIKNAFGYVNSRRKKAGLSLDKWPIPITVPVPPPIPKIKQLAERCTHTVFRRLVWSSAIAEIQAARDIFEQLTSEGILAHKVRKDGSLGRRIVRFDPTAEEVIFATGG